MRRIGTTAVQPSKTNGTAHHVAAGKAVVSVEPVNAGCIATSLRTGHTTTIDTAG